MGIAGQRLLPRGVTNAIVGTVAGVATLEDGGRRLSRACQPVQPPPCAPQVVGMGQLERMRVAAAARRRAAQVSAVLVWLVYSLLRQERAHGRAARWVGADAAPQGHRLPTATSHTPPACSFCAGASPAKVHGLLCSLLACQVGPTCMPPRLSCAQFSDQRFQREFLACCEDVLPAGRASELPRNVLK